MRELWKPLIDTDWYDVSSKGRVRSWKGPHGRTRRVRPKILKTPLTRGYPHLSINNKRRLVHRLVLEAFVGPCPGGMEGCHRNGNSADARLSNLYWGTRSQNNFDAVRHGSHWQTQKTKCPREHEYDRISTRPSGLQYRWCTECERQRWERRKAAKL